MSANGSGPASAATEGRARELDQQDSSISSKHTRKQTANQARRHRYRYWRADGGTDTATARAVAARARRRRTTFARKLTKKVFAVRGGGLSLSILRYGGRG
jgi:hypothetical protein